jgi:ketosteroid isomerase-like protein
MNELGGNVEVAGRLYEAFGRRDVDALIAVLDPGVEWELVGPSEIPYFGAYRGPEEVRRFLGLLGEHCQVDEFEIQSLVTTDRGALAEGRERGRFRGHSLAYEMRWCHVFEIDGRRVTRFTDHLDTAPMIAAWRS